MRSCGIQDLGRMRYADALRVQHQAVEDRKSGLGEDQLLLVEHPHVVTLGRNARAENVLASDEVLAKAGIEVHESDRGGDVTYHGPGQMVGYPILDLKAWKRDVGAYVRAIEQVLIDTLARLGLDAERSPGATGVWVNGAKVAAIGVHLSRWVTSHGFALNITTDLSYFQYIVPCGLTRPVTSLRRLGCAASWDEVRAVLVDEFGRQFEFDMRETVSAGRTR